MSSIRKFSQVLLIMILAFSLVVPSVAFAEPTSAEKQAEAQAALTSLNVMQGNLDKASDDYFTALAKRDEAQVGMDNAQARIDEASAHISSVQGKLGSRAKNMYRSGSATFLDVLLSSASFDEFVTNWDILNRMNEEDAAMIEEVKNLRADLEAEKEEFAKQEAIAAAQTEEAKRIKEEAEKTVVEMQALYDSLSAEAAALLEQERAAAAAAEAAAAAAAEAAAQQAAAAASGSGGSSQTGGSGFVPSYNAVTGNAIVDRAYGCMGAPYVWGACGPDSFDCSGLVSYAVSGSFSRLGTTYTFLTWSQVTDPQPGDIAVNSGHCGIYIGGGQMIHAATYGVGVIVGPVQGGMIFVRP